MENRSPENADAPPEAVDVLIVDDDTRGREAMAAALAVPGLNVVQAGSGPEALKHMMRRKE